MIKLLRQVYENKKLPASEENIHKNLFYSWENYIDKK